MQAANPFCPNGELTDTCVFVPREAAYNQIHQYLANPTSHHVFMLLGGRHMGKTTLLHHFGEVFPAHLIAVNISCKNIQANNEASFLRLCTQGIIHAFSQQQIIFGSFLTKTEGEITRQWFANEFLPPVFEAIRSRRRLILLVDDADTLTTILDNDFYVFLSDLLTRYEQLGVIFALNNALETDLQQFAPLFSMNQTHRLDNFTFDETTTFMENASHIFLVDEQAMEIIHRSSGGSPIVLQWFGTVLYDHASQSHVTPLHIPAEKVQSLLSQVVDYTAALYNEQWQQLALDERLVLTALSSLSYNNPLKPFEPEEIETWLVKTDYPLDITAIKAAIRRLEYNLIVARKGSRVNVSSGLMKTWLLNHAQLDSVPQPIGDIVPRWYWVPIILVVVIVISLAVYSGQLLEERTVPLPEDNIPTVTLESP